MKTKKKGNKVADNELKGKVVLVSGDGDYIKMVSYLLKRDKLEHILFPNSEYYSSLYKNIGTDHFSSLGEVDVRRKIEYKK